jgi:hypothetical protein
MEHMGVVLVILLSLCRTLCGADLPLVTSKLAKRRGSGGWVGGQGEPGHLGVATDSCRIERVSIHELTVERFQKDFENEMPVIVTGVTDGWPAKRKWRKKEMMKRCVKAIDGQIKFTA